jgi:carbamate kinase
VVSSPNPIEVLQRDSILEVAQSGTIVIDKGLASACLASAIGVQRLLILTSVDAVMLNYNIPQQSPILAMNCEQAKNWLQAGHFAVGSMKPKVQAGLNFLKSIDGEVIITSPILLEDALHGAGGTRITR